MGLMNNFTKDFVSENVIYFPFPFFNKKFQEIDETITRERVLICMPVTFNIRTGLLVLFPLYRGKCCGL